MGTANTRMFPGMSEMGVNRKSGCTIIFAVCLQFEVMERQD